MKPHEQSNNLWRYQYNHPPNIEKTYVLNPFIVPFDYPINYNLENLNVVTQNHIDIFEPSVIEVVFSLFLVSKRAVNSEILDS